MKTSLMLIVVLTIGLLAITGCKELVGTTSPSNSFPVQMGIATTNDPQLVAWERVALSANQTLNPTPTSPLVSTILTAIIGITSIVAGAYVHKHGVDTGVDSQLDTSKPNVK